MNSNECNLKILEQGFIIWLKYFELLTNIIKSE